MFIKWFFLIIFFAVMIACGFFARRKTKSISDFVLGGRNVGPWMSAFAYGTAYFSAVVFVGYAGQFGWRYGISASWIGIGNALLGSLLAWVVLGRRTRIMTNHLFSATMPDFFGKRYNSKNLTLVASAIIFIFLVPYTASVYNGLSRLFEMAFGMPFMYCVIGMAALTAAYVILGGYLATAINDFIQGIIMLIGIVVIIGSVLASEGGLTESLTKLSFVNGAAEEGIRQAGVFTSFFGPDPVGLISVIILTSLGTWGLPQMIHKFYAIKSEKAITTGTVVSTVFAIIIAGGSYFLGGFARLFDSPAIHKDGGGIIFDAIIPSMLANMSDIVIAVTIVLVLSASMSTLASLVITSSSTMTLD
ncbi:MAG: sodium:solute symporter, partial [Clostridia bacterium]|nr:sodium:solute symporter [Clostridia bacterium]